MPAAFVFLKKLLRGDDLYRGAHRGAAVEVTLALRRKFDETCNLGEKGVILTDADVAAGHDLRAALADDDFPDADRTTIAAFDAEVFRIRIVQVFSCSGGLCCCHKV
jgi:hypothetical protein